MYNEDEYYLEVLCETEQVQCYHLKKTRGWGGSTVFMFTPAGICISGDICVTGSGVISRERKNLRWFLGELEPDYLAGKFLSKGWCEELAESRVIYWLSEPDFAKYWPDLYERWTDEVGDPPEFAGSYMFDWSLEGVREIFESDHVEWYDEWYDCGHGYNPYHVDELSRLQKLFVKCFNKLKDGDQNDL